MPHPATFRPVSRVPHVLLVTVLVALALAEVLSGLNSVVHPPGHFGFGFNPSPAAEATITNVDPSSAAADAGLRSGDRIQWKNVDAADRYRLESAVAHKPAGMSIRLPVMRDGKMRMIAMTSRIDPGAQKTAIATIIAIAVTILFLGIAAALVLLRPTIVTWSFLLLASGYSMIQFGSLHGMLLPPWTEFHAVLLSVALGAAVWGGGMFLSRFPDGTQTLGRWYEVYLTAASTTLAILFFIIVGVFHDFASRQGPLSKAYLSIMIVTVLISIVLTLARYRHGGPERARGRWVILGCSVGLIALALDYSLRLIGVANFSNSPLDIVLTSALVLFPISTAYAILRHRVIDVNFVISRALLYGAITSALIAMFSVVEFLIGKRLQAGGTALFVEVAGALTIGFWFKLIHTRLERWFESIFFQAQHRAEQYLRRVAAAIPHAAAVETVDLFLTAEPATAYRLSSAALFRRDAQKRFVRVAAVGWPADATGIIEESDPLVAFLLVERETIDLEELGWTVPGLPGGAAHPVVAAPIGARSRLTAIALYGAHQSGEALDPDEQRMLLDLANAAAAAYDHLEAEALRREIGALRLRFGPSAAPAS